MVKDTTPPQKQRRDDDEDQRYSSAAATPNCSSETVKLTKTGKIILFHQLMFNLGFLIANIIFYKPEYTCFKFCFSLHISFS